MDNYIITKRWTKEDDEMLDAPVVFYEAPRINHRDLLNSFMPDCLPVIKRNINLLKTKRKDAEKLCGPLFEDALDRIYTLDFSVCESYRDVFISVNKWFWVDRIINPIDAKIRELEQLLKMSQIQEINSPDAHLDLQKAKQYPFNNLVKVNHAGFTTCVFHNEKTASMKIYKDNRFHCFGCGKDGDVIDFVMQRDGVDFKTAIKFLQ